MAIYIGSKKVKDVYYGNRKVAKIYKGNNLIYQSNVTPSLPSPDLAYAYYVSSDGLEHFYAKAPLGNDLIKYGVNFTGSEKATNISEIQPIVSPGNGATQYWESVTAEIAIAKGGFEFIRDTSGDFTMLDYPPV